MTAWVKTKTNTQFDDHLGLAELTLHDFINQGKSIVEFYRLLECEDFDEDFLRVLLSKYYNNVFEWVVIHVQFDPRLNAYTVLACSRKFPKTSPGQVPTAIPRIQ